jgi:hypothetical protein
MNCYYHADTQAVAFCRSCGRPVCQQCQRPEGGTVFCPEHATAASTQTPGNDPSNPYFQPSSGAAPGVQTSPGLAFALGLIPGVGAIYNAQYIKGLVHAVIFGLIVSLLSSNDTSSAAPFLGIILAAFLFYMPFEAFHTARKRQSGIAVDEWSSFAGPPRPGRPGVRNSAGPAILIGIGVLFLLDNLDLIEFRRVGRFWPVILIASGAYMLYTRTASNRTSLPSGDAGNRGPAYGSAPYPATPYGAPPSGEPEGRREFDEGGRREQ